MQWLMIHSQAVIVRVSKPLPATIKDLYLVK